MTDSYDTLETEAQRANYVRYQHHLLNATVFGVLGGTVALLGFHVSVSAWIIETGAADANPFEADLDAVQFLAGAAITAFGLMIAMSAQFPFRAARTTRRRLPPASNGGGQR